MFSDCPLLSARWAQLWLSVPAGPQAMLLQCGLYCRRMVVRFGSLTIYSCLPLLHWVVGITHNAYLNVLHEVLLNVLLELW